MAIDPELQAALREVDEATNEMAKEEAELRAAVDAVVVWALAQIEKLAKSPTAEEVTKHIADLRGHVTKLKGVSSGMNEHEQTLLGIAKDPTNPVPDEPPV